MFHFTCRGFRLLATPLLATNQQGPIKSMENSIYLSSHISNSLYSNIRLLATLYLLKVAISEQQSYKIRSRFCNIISTHNQGDHVTCFQLPQTVYA